jgi:hypothetical protein
MLGRLSSFSSRQACGQRQSIAITDWMDDRPTALAAMRDRMTYCARPASRTKGWESEAMGKTQSNAAAVSRRGAEPLAVIAIALAAIALILAINISTRPLPAATYDDVALATCADCGTVIAVRRSAHSTPVYFVEVRLLDGSVRTVQQSESGYSVGDFVQINGTRLTLRNTPS